MDLYAFQDSAGLTIEKSVQSSCAPKRNTKSANQPLTISTDDEEENILQDISRSIIGRKSKTPMSDNRSSLCLS